MSASTNYIRQEAKRIATTAKRAGSHGVAKGKVFTGRRRRKLKIRA